MAPLGRVRWIFVHTAAFDGEASARRIRDWHLDRGWEDIGYHFVVRRDGEIEPGRSTRFAGAHVYGANRNSLGICCEGHGDHEDHTSEQRAALIDLLEGLMKYYAVPVESVLGHREINLLVDAEVLPEEIGGRSLRTTKTCPGVMVSMKEIRDEFRVPKMVDSIIEEDE